MADTLRVVILKPSKYTADSYVERFRWGFMPNSTVPYMRSMTPAELSGTQVEVHSIDEYVHTDLEYLSLLRRPRVGRTLLALVGVQSHQFHRALDLAAYARRNGCMAVIGGPHVMTCDTSMLHGHGVSFALAEAELVWQKILEDAAGGELRPVYGTERRWQQELEAPVVVPPDREDLRRYVLPMLGLYPARGCPFTCSFCSVIKIAGRRIRSQSIGTTLASLRAAKTAGVRHIMFTSDNFNKYPEASELLESMVKERLGLDLFVQCDTQIARQEQLVALLAQAGCSQMFVGVESFSRPVLLAAKKGQNRPETYRDIVRLCREHRINSHFSNIIGFPQDTERDVDRHLEMLRELCPAFASFYILCPIPGTEQYDEFMAGGLITEDNLDRFDTTCLTWRHPHFSREQLAGLLFRCYRKFYSVGHAVHSLMHRGWFRSGLLAEAAGIAAMSLFNQYCAWQRAHSMSGGVMRILRDRVGDYLDLRRKAFGFDLVPLPRSLPLSAADSLLNRGIHAHERASSSRATRPPSPIRSSSVDLVGREAGGECQSTVGRFVSEAAQQPQGADWD